MGAYVLRRILVAIPILFGITIISFLLLASAPGDPVRALISPEQLAHMTEAQVQQRRVALGLDGGPVVRYIRWVGLGPILGPFIAQFLRGGAEIGPDTLARFYSLHMLLIPGAIFALIGLHLYLVIRLGVTSPPWSREAAGADWLEEQEVSTDGHRTGLTRPTPRNAVGRRGEVS